MVFWLSLFAIIAILGVGGLVALRILFPDSPLAAKVFAAKAEPRIGVIEQASVDSRRRLLLVRRDNVEHLIMTGGPVDVVIETGIGAPRLRIAAERSAADLAEPAQTVYARPARNLGQVVNE